MNRARHFANRVRARGLLALLGVCASASPALAQAWVPPARVGVVSVVFQDINNTNHRLNDGSLFDGYDSVSRGFFLNLDYAVTDRFSFSVGLPYIASKYTGPEPSLFGLPIDDCFCWNSGWQDLAGTLRYNIANGAFALTPSASFGMPTHNYDYFGEAVLGRNLNEVRLAIDAGHRLDTISERLSVTGRYSYTIVEKRLDVSTNRSNFGFEVEALATRKLAGRVGFLWQRTHGGLRSSEFTTDEQYQQYDRLIKDDNFHIAAGASYSLPRVDVFAALVHYTSGRDTHVGRAISFGIGVPFER